MGANISSQMTSVVNETITDQSTNIMNSTSVSTSNVLDNNQKMNVDLKVGGTVKNCSLNFLQDMKIVNKVYTKIDSQQQQDIQKKLQEDLDNKLKSTLEQSIKDIPVGSVNMSKTNTVIQNSSIHDLSNTFVNSLVNNVNNAIDNSQDQVIRINIGGDLDCSKQGNLLVAQNIDIDNIIENTLKDSKVSQAVNDYVKKVENDLELSTIQKIVGFNPLQFITTFAITGVIGLIVIATAITLITYFSIKGKINNVKSIFSRKSSYGRRKLRKW